MAPGPGNARLVPSKREGQKVWAAHRPGMIYPLKRWGTSCHECGWKSETLHTYQEASIALTVHLNGMHEGWDEE